MKNQGNRVAIAGEDCSSTPRNGKVYSLRPHVPTPKLSDRKKSLFSDQSLKHGQVEENSDLGPMSPLKFSNSPKSRIPMKDVNITSFRNVLGHTSPDSDRSLSPDFERRFSHSERYEIISVSCGKENHDLDEDTRLSFPTNPTQTPPESILQDETNSNSLSFLMNSDLKLVEKETSVLKTPGLTEGQHFRKGPKISFRKLSCQEENLTPSEGGASKFSINVPGESKARTSLSFNDIQPISTKSFYASTKENKFSGSKSFDLKAAKQPVSRRITLPISKKRTATKKRDNRNRIRSFNRGVFHKIKKPSSRQRTAIKKLSTSQIIQSTSALLNSSFDNSKSEKSTPIKELEPQLMHQLERVKRLLRNSKNPIEQARPLSLSRSMGDLSSISEHFLDESSDDDSNESENDAKSESGGRKFFKSNSNKRLKPQYKVVNNLSLTVQKGGKFVLNKTKMRKRKLSQFDEEFNFSSEQLEVDDIIKKLSHSNMEPDVKSIVAEQFPLQSSSANDIIDTEKYKSTTIRQPETVQIEVADISNDEPIPLQSNVIFVNRFSPILNISDDSNAKEKTNLDSERQSISKEAPADFAVHLISTDRSVAEEIQNEAESQTGNLFPIFYKDHQRANHDTTCTTNGGLFENIKNKPTQRWQSTGLDQYQIDAGQKDYGARQCDECGLVYSVHEPEDEMIHQSFHNSLQVLKFNGWNDETVVSYVPEWDVTGRIIAVSTIASKSKLQKIYQVLEVVDRDLGFVKPHKLIMGSMVYLAVARSLILGVCVAQPLRSANRLLTIQGIQGPIDCCTMEAYPVMCGISRIWVSPKFRRRGIAHMLLKATKSHFIFGHVMPYDEIAFSSPTEEGKRLAEAVTGRKDFLIYV